MKMKNLFFAVAVVSFALFVSCGENNNTVTPSVNDTTFSKLTVEQNKTNIETSGQEMLNEVQSMENEPAMQANISLVTHISSSDPFTGNPNLEKKINLSKTVAFAPAFTLASFEPTEMKSVLKSLQVNPSEDPESFQELYDLLIGVYTWNAAGESWDYSATGDNIVFLFPSEDNGTTNNASYTVTYAGYTGPNPIDEEYSGDLPQDISAVLKVDGATVSSFIVAIDYNSEGYPVKIESTFSLGTWVWYAMASNTNNSAFATEFSFKHGDKILLKFTLDASGNWTEENITANTHYFIEYYNEQTNEWYWEEVTSDDDYDRTEVDVHKVINSGNASFQALNLKIVGNIDALTLVDGLEQIDETYDWETQEAEAIDAQVELINTTMSLTLRYADNNEIIALVEAYPVEREDTYISWEYNETTGNYEPVTITDTYITIELRFVFADDSSVDFETYFNEGFEELIDELEQYLDELEETYGK